MVCRPLAFCRTHSSSDWSRSRELGVLLALDGEALLLLLQVGGVVALVGERAAAVELEDPLRDVVQEVPVVGHREHGARVLRQVLLQPQHALGVEVVGRLVEQQQVGGLEQQLAQRDAAALATGQHADVGVGRRQPQRVHRLLDLAVELPRAGGLDLVEQRCLLLEDLLEVGVGGAHLLVELLVPQDHVADALDALLHVLQDVLALVEDRLLHQDADAVAGAELGVAVGRLVQAGHHLQHGRLAGAVRSEDADLRARVERDRDVVEDDLVPDRLADLLHLVDELRHRPRLRERVPGGRAPRSPPPPAPPGPLRPPR